MSPPSALTQKPKPTMKKVSEETAMTRLVFNKITLLFFILIEPVSFIMKPAYARIIIIMTTTTHTVSSISDKSSILFSMSVCAYYN